MQGEIDSMNVSVAAAILIFEAKRQRRILTQYFTHEKAIPLFEYFVFTH